MLNYRIILRILGLFLIVESVFMGLSGLVSVSFLEPEAKYLFYSASISMVVGLLLQVLGYGAKKDFGKREGYIIVSLVWVVFSAFGFLPFYLSGSIPSITDSFFETMSGFTTTGSSILNDIEALPYGMLFWRSIIQWLGGIGIIVISLSVLPMLGVGGMQLFMAEVPGPTPDKLTPKVKETAKRLWLIYSVLTLIETVLLRLGGMSWFDAINHAFTTMATGGYSTKQDSVAHWNSPYIHYIIIIFMFLAGTNFSLVYFAMKGQVSKMWKNEEFRYYLGFVLAFSALVTAGLIVMHGFGAEQATRDSLFQVISIITTTGFATADYEIWAPVLMILMFVLMFFGGSAGSTGGGPKIVRVLMLLKNSYYELKRLVHPNAILPIRYNNHVVSTEIVTNVLAFFVFYIIIILLSVVILSAVGLDFDTAFGAVVTSIGNIGPGIGDVGPSENFAHLPAFGKWYLAFLMLLGRLELFTVLVVLSPAFWKR